MIELFKNKPDDLALTIPEIQTLSEQIKTESFTRPFKPSSMRINVDGLRVKAQIHGEDYKLNWWSYRQICQLVGLPLTWAHKLNAPMLSINLNYGLRNRSREMQMMVTNGVLRAITGPTYKRVWDHDVINTTSLLASTQFKPHKAYKNVTHTQLVMLSDEEEAFFDPISERYEPLRRGFKIMNSEVGASSIVLALFWFRSACSNGLIFGQRTQSYSCHRHVGANLIRKVNSDLDRMLLNLHSEEEIELMKRAARVRVSATGDALQSHLVNKARLNEKEATRVIELAQKEEGSTASKWVLANGITALARTKSDAMERNRLQKLAGRYIERG